MLDDKKDDDHRRKKLPVVTKEILDDSWKLLGNTKIQSISQMRQEIEGHPSSESMENEDISNSRQVPQIRQFIWGTTSGMTMVVPVYMGGRKISAVVDTAAQVTLISSKLWGTLQVGSEKTPELVQLSNAEKDSCMEGQLYTHVGFALGGRKYFSDVVAANIADDMILGLDFLKSNKWKIDLEDDSLEMANGDKIYATMEGGHYEKRYNVSRVMLNRKVTIDPHQIAFVSVRLDNPAAVTYAVEPVEKASLFSPSIVVQGNDEMTFCLLNMSPKMWTLSRKAAVAECRNLPMAVVLAGTRRNVDHFYSPQ